MEMGMVYDTIAVSCTFVFLMLVWKVYNWVWLTPKRVEKCLKQQGFKGNSYKFLVGDLKENAKLIAEANSKPMNLSHDIVPRAFPDVHNTISKHGKLSFMWIGKMPKLLILDPELIREVLTNHHIFQKHFVAQNPLTRFLLTGIGSYEGEQWARHRRIIGPSYHVDKLKLMLPAFYEIYDKEFRKWEKVCSTEGACEVDVFPIFDTLTSDVIAKTAFGSSYEEGRKIFLLLKELMDLTIETMRSLYFPGWSLVPIKRHRRLKEVERDLYKMIGAIINSRVKAMKAGDATENDLLGSLLESNFKELEKHGNQKHMAMSPEEVYQECKLFYFAGQETTGILLTWTMVALSMNPEWQVRAREEIFQVFGKGKPDYDGVNNLKYVNMILHEMLRLYPPVPDLTKFVHHEAKLGNYTIPAGVELMLPSFQIHRDPEVWGEDALEFNPQRFSEGVNKATKGKVSFIPFSWGPRMCLGQNFALLQAKMGLTMVLQCFSVELSPSYTHAPLTILTLQPQHGAQVIFRKLY